MPKYVVVDSQDQWLEVGEYDTPEEAVAGAKETDYFDNPEEIWVYEFISEILFFKTEEGDYKRY